jgi:hypothetical protein
MEELPDSELLGVARQKTRDEAEKGTTCPCCQQFVKVYKYTINASQAHALIEMYKHASQGWFHMVDIEHRWRSHDHARLRHWGLIEKSGEKRDDGGDKGNWRITPLGARFVLNQIRVPKYARVYNNRTLRLHGEPVSIVDALKNRFDYHELMGR